MIIIAPLWKRGAILDFRLFVRHNFCFPSIEIDRISPNFVYTLILTRSKLGLLHIIFRTFVIELRPLIDVRISFRILFWLNILRTERYNFTKFCICVDIDKIKDWIVTQPFLAN